MLQKVLVANRGEIAVRVIRTLREMGIVSVAIYSDEDRGALHVRMADEAYNVGPAPTKESYLRADRILDVCKQAGVDGVHPGYGFLSENAEFSRACHDAGITFIGPDASAMEAMASKTAARERMIAAGVPVVPGAHVGTVRELEAAAKKLGFPVLLKASAGGGGKGMRLVHRAEDVASAFERARSEAKSFFGDDHVYVEKAIVGARHVEIQVLGDRHGSVVHFFERDCSIQRRHQKVVEETPSPSPHANEALIEKMGEVAVRAAKAVDYHSAGTVEFLLSPNGEFYFLEMNTRLQVEHPITELITGTDLVREQVRIAAGEPLGYTQADIRRLGHAIECRIYAEDPATGFLPSPGRIEVLRVPAGPGVRDDSGTYEGATISSYYDPLVSKLSVWARTREEAIDRMRRALCEYVVIGPRTNVPFHLALLAHEAFRRGEYDTGFLERHAGELGIEHPSEDEAREVALALAALTLSTNPKGNGHTEPTGTATAQPSAWRRALY